MSAIFDPMKVYRYTFGAELKTDMMVNNIIKEKKTPQTKVFILSNSDEVGSAYKILCCKSWTYPVWFLTLGWGFDPSWTPEPEPVSKNGPDTAPIPILKQLYEFFTIKKSRPWCVSEIHVSSANTLSDKNLTIRIRDSENPDPNPAKKYRLSSYSAHRSVLLGSTKIP